MSQNGWKKWEKKAGGSRYTAYESRMVVLVTNTKSAFIYLMPPVMKALNNPEYIEVYTRGSNIAFFRAEDAAGAYKVVTNNRGAHPYVSLAALIKNWNISPGAYDAHIEDDHIVFDTQQRPSKLG